MDSTSLEATVSSAAFKGMSAGTGVTLFGWVISNETIALLGLVIAILGFVVNLVFKVRDDRRKQQMHNLKMFNLQSEAATRKHE